ncbi:hypothetical protein WA158_001124 [Blastocystis sp. Blastoise]
MKFLIDFRKGDVKSQIEGMKQFLNEINNNGGFSFSEKMEALFIMMDYLKQKDLSCYYIILICSCLESLYIDDFNKLYDSIPDVVKSIRVSLMNILSQDVCDQCKFAVVRLLCIYRQSGKILQKEVPIVNEINKQLEKTITCEHFNEYKKTWKPSKLSNALGYTIRTFLVIITLCLSLFTDFKIEALLLFLISFPTLTYFFPINTIVCITTDQCNNCSCSKVCGKCHFTLKTQHIPLAKKQTIMTASPELIIPSSLPSIPEETETQDNSASSSSLPTLSVPTTIPNPLPINKKKEIEKIAKQNNEKIQQELKKRNIKLDSTKNPILLPDSLGKDLIDLKQKLLEHDPINKELLAYVEEGIQLFNSLDKK